MLHSSHRSVPLKRKVKGFTLVELLVVIAIIAILSAILFPVFARVRQSARRTSCTSNLRNIGSAIAQYTVEYDEQYPGAYRDNGAGERVSYAQMIQPYIKSSGLFICLAATDHVTKSGTTLLGGPDNPNVSATGIDYGYACLPNISNPTNAVYPPPTMAEIEAPSATIVVADVDATNTGGEYDISDPSRTDWGGGINGAPTTRHLEGGNVLYYDGHVKFLKHTVKKDWCYLKSCS